mgnify:CR=1 FL=1
MQTWGSTWALKKISSTTGGGLAGVRNENFNMALADDVSVPGESEVLWTYGETTGQVYDDSGLKFSSLDVKACLQISHQTPAR